LVRIGYDFQIFGEQERGGISRYFCELARWYRTDSGLGVDAVFAWGFNGNRHAKETGIGRPAALISPIRWRYRRRLYKAASLPYRRRLRDVDVLHPTYYVSPPHRYRPNQGVVVTVHDMIPEVFPELFRRNPHRHKASHIRHADLIIAPSEATRRDMLRLVAEVSAPIQVIPHGVGELFFEPPRDVRRLVKFGEYVLHVGDRRGYKDFSTLLQGFAHVRHDYRCLIAAGGGPFTPSERCEISSLGLADRVFWVSPDDAELRDLYHGAAAFVFPSRYEGFGLPTLEALASGCSALLANCSSHPEIGGDAAIYFEPGDAVSLARGLLRLVRERNLREDLARRGPERARLFTWAKAAAATADAYRSVAGAS
jgi:glycosyltransferase involved in cell wall biosynthesis